MRSIRLSLLCYFLGLLAVALGTASVLAYQIAQRTLRDKKATNEELISRRFQQRCREEDSRLDEGLRLQAQTIAKVVQIRMDWNKARHQQLHLLGVLSSQLAPSGYALFPVWWAESIVPERKRGQSLFTLNPLYWEVSRSNLPEIAFNDDDLPDHWEKGQADFYEINTLWGSSVRSPSLGSQHFPFDPSPDQVLFTRFDDVTLPSGEKVRRVLIKTPIVRSGLLNPLVFRPSPFNSGTGRPGGQTPERERPELSRTEPSPVRPPLFIHCAYRLARRAEAYVPWMERRDEELVALQAETDEALAHVRTQLLILGSVTFLFALVGSVWLVRSGLSPLRRLSEAVRQISPSNFELPALAERLPVELKPIVQRLKETLELLHRAFAREKRAAADISHELRTPIAVMLTTTELALRKPRSAEEYREMLTDCRLSAQQMNEVVQRLLTLARLDAGVDQMVRRPIDMAQLAEQCVSMVRPLAEAQGLTLTVHSAPSLPLQADPDKLREVLNNLLHNAIQYNRPHGSIDLSVRRDSNQVCLEVSDTGIGIHPEVRGQIFQRFYRADPSRCGDGLHAGLGLALVKEYVDLMGGHIDVDSTEGQGSTFRVRLPA